MRKLSFLFASVISILSYSQATRELIVSDTRDIDDLPNAFSRNFKIDFKKRNTINVPGSGAYSTTISVNPWVNRDNSGGKVHQLNFNDGGIYHRSALPL
ncbi:cell wall anchor protein, partial [Riemerella anatipestifer]|nr:cell wall anchor protein [Riemerella anatipestifer]